MLNIKKKKSTSRYDPQNVHNEFGVLNWLKKTGVVEQVDTDRFINGFCEKNGFKDPKNKKKIRRAKIAFIQNRFTQFCSYTKNQIKAMHKPELI